MLISRKQEILQDVHEKCGETKGVCDTVMSAFLAVIQDHLVRGRLVHLHSFGKFRVVEIPARRRFNIGRGESHTIPRHHAVRFSYGKTLRGAVNGGGDKAAKSGRKNNKGERNNAEM